MMKFGKGISCTIKSPPFLACLYISHQVKRAFVGELSRLVLTTQLLLVDCFSSCKFQVVATVALIVHHSVAIIPMPYTDWTALLLLFKVSNDNVRPQQHRTAPETMKLGSFGNVCGYYSELQSSPKKIMANRV